MTLVQFVRPLKPAKSVISFLQNLHHAIAVIGQHSETFAVTHSKQLLNFQIRYFKVLKKQDLLPNSNNTVLFNFLRMPL